MGIIKTKSKGILIVVSGPSGAGKDTICNELTKINKNVWISISMTSRAIRGQEQNGVEYFFVSKEEFEERIKEGKFLEYALYNNNYYGTPKDKINEYLDKGIDVILVIEIQGAGKIKELISDALFIFIMPPSMKELKRRLTDRKTECEDKVFERFKIAYKEVNEVTKYNYVVVNDDISLATAKVEAIITAEKCRVDRIEEVELNNIEEDIHESLIED